MADQEQEQMWGVVLKHKERKEGFTSTKKKKSFSSASSSSSCLSAAWQLPTHTAQEKMISKAKYVNSEAPQQKPSAPVKIPGWYNGDGSFVENEGGDDEDEETMVPIHEYMAKKMARTRSASHSMCEGVGRTLKGRDLCKLRNAILSQTGFLD